MKYDLAKIMKRAWELKKENSKNIFSACLKMAWLEAKIEVVIAENTFEEKFSKKSYYKTVKRWTKNGMDRLYIPRSAYEDAGYIDLANMKSYPSRPGNGGMLKDILSFLR